MPRPRVSHVTSSTSLAAALVLAALAPTARADAAAPAAPTPDAVARATAQYLAAPLAFEDARPDGAGADFRSRGAGATTWLTAGGAVFAVPSGPATTVVRMELVDADARARPTALDPQPGVVREYRGDDPAAWRTRATFGRIRYDAVYPGIDAIYYGTQRKLEYDFAVAPGADPGRIALRFAGADRVERTVTGSLIVTAGGAQLEFAAPVAYQPTGAGRRAVAAGFRTAPGLDGTTTVSFALGGYDPTLPLVIDPVVTYAGYLSGSLSDRGYAIAVDAAGQAHATGYTYSLNFPTTTGVVLAGSQDVFVTKVAADGLSLVYSTLIGGNAFDVGRAIALDATGSIYLTGSTSSTNFPTTAGALDTTHNGNSDVFVAKLSAAGVLTASTFIGGSGNDEPDAIAVDYLNRPYVTGKTEGGAPAFPTTFGAADTSYNGGAWDAFALRLAANFASLNYSTFIGGGGYDYGQGIALDQYKAIVVGYTTSAAPTPFPVAGTPAQAVYGGAGDGFITKLSADGAAFTTSGYLGGTTADSLEAIAVGGQGSVFVTGWTTTTAGVAVAYPTTAGSFGTIGAGGTDVVVTKLDATLATRTYSGTVGSLTNDYGYGIAITSGGAAVVVGLASSNNFPQVAATQVGFGGNVSDGFVIKVGSTGSVLNFASYLGGTGADTATGVALDSADAAYVTGETNAGFPTTAGAFGVVANGAREAFAAKITF